MIGQALRPADGPVDTAWCANCQAPSVVQVRGAGYCAGHDPRQVQVTMPLAEARLLLAWFDGDAAHAGMAVDLRDTLTAVVALADGAPGGAP